jgi:hypothetical protein
MTATCDGKVRTVAAVLLDCYADTVCCLYLARPGYDVLQVILKWLPLDWAACWIAMVISAAWMLPPQRYGCGRNYMLWYLWRHHHYRHHW